MLWFAVAASVAAMVLCAGLMRAAGRAAAAEEFARARRSALPDPARRNGGTPDA